jgi:hypothetical protein
MIKLGPQLGKFSLTKVHLEGHVAPLFTYIGGLKGEEALYLSIKSSILGASIDSIFFFAMGQSNGLVAKKIKGLVMDPQLI